VDQAGDPVEEAELHDVEPGEPRERRQHELAHAGALAARVHRLGLQRRVAVLLGEVGIERFGGRVQQIARETAHRAVGDDVLVDGVVGPAGAPAVEKAHVPVGIAFAMGQPAAKQPVAAGERVRGGDRGRAMRRQRRADCRRELWRQALVGVEAQHPVVPRLAHREVLLRAVARPRMRDHPRTEAARDFYGIIAAAGIDDDDLARKRHRRKAGGELRASIAGDDTEAKGERPGHAPCVRGAGSPARE
jgi:hypothetical protein